MSKTVIGGRQILSEPVSTVIQEKSLLIRTTMPFNERDFLIETTYHICYYFNMTWGIEYFGYAFKAGHICIPRSHAPAWDAKKDEGPTPACASHADGQICLIINGSAGEKNEIN